MKKKVSLWLVLVLCISFLMPGIDGYAFTTRQKAMNAYKSWLSKSTIYADTAANRSRILR